MSMQNLNKSEKQIAADLYAAIDRTVDDLPYTADFDAMLDQFRSITDLEIGPHEFWKALTNLRKARHLVRKMR